MREKRLSHSLRLFAIALQPALVVAERCNLNLDEVTEVMHRAYVQQLEHRGHSREAMARILGRTKRGVIKMINRFKELDLPEALSRRNQLDLQYIDALVRKNRSLLRSEFSDVEWTGLTEAAERLQAFFDATITDDRIEATRVSLQAEDEFEECLLILGTFFRTVSAALEQRHLTQPRPRPGVRMGNVSITTRLDEALGQRLVELIHDFGCEEDLHDEASGEVTNIAVCISSRPLQVQRGA